MPRQTRERGRTLAVLVCDESGSLVSRRLPAVRVELTGFENDKHSGWTRPADGRTPQYPKGSEMRNGRQVSILSREELAGVAQELGIPAIEPEQVGANLLLEGIPRLTQLPPGTRLVFPTGTVLRVEAANAPCVHPGRVLAAAHGRQELASAFPKAALRRRGVVATVERPGTIAEGDEATVEPPEHAVYGLAPIGWVENAVAAQTDQDWGLVESRLVLLPELRAGLRGLAEFSHAIVVTWLDQASFSRREHLRRRPRGLSSMPELGIFAQRAKDRPNPLGVTAVRILEVGDDAVTVRGLDAIDGTPVVDLKPYFAQYDRVEAPVSPPWVAELMRGYF